jgi:hypothetical protein
VSGELLERSKDALDELYMRGSSESERVLTALEVYGINNFADEFKYCIDEILKVCDVDKATKLRSLVFKQKAANPFPSVFAILVFAFHELIVKDGKKISDYPGVKKAITNLSERIEIGRKATSPDERRKNIDTVKGLISSCFIAADVKPKIYGNYSTTDIEAVIRRSEIELADYELKQGLLSLSHKREVDPHIVDKVLRTICAIANNGPNRTGKLIIGVTDNDADAARIKQLDDIEPKKVGKRFVVGVAREAKALGITLEAYFSKWKDGIKGSKLSPSLRASVMSNIDFNSFYGLGIILITILPQNELSYVGEDIYWRNGDSTERAETPKQIATLAKRF